MYGHLLRSFPQPCARGYDDRLDPTVKGRLEIRSESRVVVANSLARISEAAELRHRAVALLP